MKRPEPATRIGAESLARATKPSHTTLPLAIAAAAGIAIMAPSGAAHATIKSNTQIKLHGKAAIGDVDGDGLQDLIYPAGTRILATKVSARNTGILHGYVESDVTRVIVGYFKRSTTSPGVDQTCALLHNGKLRCYVTTKDRRSLTHAFQQNSPIGPRDEAIVADFDGDGLDDILRYRPSTGQLALLSYGAKARKFVPNAAISFGMRAKNIRHKQLRAGEFDGRTDHADLLVWDPKTGKVSRYDTVQGPSGLKMTYRFMTNRVVMAGERLHVANIDGSNRDGIALSRSSGQFRFFKAERAGSHLRPNPIPRAGQLASKGGGTPFFGHFVARDSEPGSRRDDVVLHQAASKRFTRMSARWDDKAKRHTYWWGYSSKRPTVHEGWPLPKLWDVVVLRCRLEGAKADVGTQARFEQLFGLSGRDKDGLWDYIRDISYGTHLLNTTVMPGWKNVDKTLGQVKAIKGRGKKIKVCTDAWDVDLSKYETVVVVYNQRFGFGATGGKLVAGRKVLERNNALFHEVLHTFGLPHAFDTSDRADEDWAESGQYHDEFDPMGGIGLESGTGKLGKRPPHTNAFFKEVLGMMPPSRVRTLKPGSKPKTTVIKLAPLNRPEVNGPMLLTLGIRNSSEQLVVEYREPWGWDGGLPEKAVIVRRVKTTPKPSEVGHKTKGRVTYLPRDAPGPTLTKGESLRWGGATIKVLKFDAVEGRAEIEVRH